MYYHVDDGDDDGDDGDDTDDDDDDDDGDGDDDGDDDDGGDDDDDVRACAVEMHMHMSQEAFCAEIYRENATRAGYPRLNTGP